MRPLRASGGGFGFPSVRSIATRLAIGLVALSLVAAVLLRSAGFSLYLIPGDVFRGLAVWQPITFLLLETTPLGVIFGALILWSIGGALESSWGSRRLLAFTVGITLVSGLLTLALAAAVPGLQMQLYAGGMVMSSAVWVAYGLAIGRGQVSFWGLPVTGHVFAGIAVLFVALNAAMGGGAAVIPEVFGLAMTFGYMKLGSPRFLWLKFQSWRLGRQLKSRSKHLRVIDDGRNMPRDSDRYLH